ncbi:DUF460 domain-containing protein [Thermofilum pendens]|uniref:DUF460 domain-containing protein n=1 Tax=Thermofilum pendens (strain DSM 2475 / Hrk 5) TaxID=368408 RepID=A1RY60_THEPD|nr:DUF460 domain-containing protein [Thermofilum pendens]ABL78140.1 Protein of unknown function DUF460 [Thermofilum pendens Hrk 5]
MAFRRVLGLDILPGSSPLGRQHLFAAVLLVDGRVEQRVREASLEDVVRLATSGGVEALALDNVFELAPTVEGLAEFLRLFPGRPPRLIQVTVVNGEEVSVETLCAVTGLCRGRLDPLGTAEACALLAYAGVGSEVLVFHDETVVHVGRGRVPGQGGMSRERFKRGIEVLVKRKVREIAEALQRKGLDFDVFPRKSGEGLVGATFIVYAPREELNGVVKSEEGHDLFVRVEPARRDRVEFRPLGSRLHRALSQERLLIVGVDPGMATGFAVLDFSGRVLAVDSRRLLGRGQLVRELYGFGRPAIVATDVNPPPAYVKKLASTLGAVLYVPSRSLSVEEKRRLALEAAGQQGVRLRTSHERDSLAAAYKAFLSYRELFEEVEREAARYGVPFSLDEAKLLAVKGKPVALAVEEALRRQVGVKIPRIELQKEAEEPRRVEEELEEVRRALSELLRENVELRRRLEEAEERARRSEEALRGLLRAREVARGLESEYAKLRARIELLQSELDSFRRELAEKERALESLGDALLSYLSGEAVVAVRLSYVLERGAARVPAVYVDKQLPSDSLRRVLEELKPPGSHLIAFFEGAARGAAERLPLGVVPVALGEVKPLAEVGPFVFVPAETALGAATASRDADKERLRRLLEDYRLQRKRELEGLSAGRL